MILTASSHTSECVPRSGFQWNLQNVDSALGIDQPEGMHAKALHHSIAARDGAVGHDPHQHVGGFGHQGDKIPEGVVRRGGLRHLVVGFGLRRMNQIGKFHRILDEEHRDVVADQIPIALIRVELHRETAHIARRVGRATLAGHGRESDEHRCLLAGLREGRRPGQLGQGFVGFKVAVRGGATRMDDALGDPLMIKMGDFLAKNEVLEQRLFVAQGCLPKRAI